MNDDHELAFGSEELNDWMSTFQFAERIANRCGRSANVFKANLIECGFFTLPISNWDFLLTRQYDGILLLVLSARQAFDCS
jgi:hypothetical protein